MAENFDFKGDPATPIPAPSAPMSEPTDLPPTEAPQAPRQVAPPERGVVGPPRTKEEIQYDRETAVLEAAVEAVKTERLQEAEPSKPLEDVPFVKGFLSGAGFSITGTLFRAAQEAVQSGDTTLSVDVDHMRNKEKYAKDTGRLDQQNKLFQAVSTDPRARQMVADLANAPNSGVTNELWANWDRQMLDADIQARSSLLAFAPGVIFGMGADIAATVFVSGGLGLPGIAAQSLRAVSISQARISTARTLALWGLAEGVGVTAIEDLSGVRTGIPLRQYILAGSMGGLIGAGLGAGFPRLLGRVIVKGDFERAQAKLEKTRIEYVQRQSQTTTGGAPETGGDGGAALNVSEVLTRDLPTTGFATPVGRAVSKKVWIWPGMGYLRAPKSLYRDLVVYGEESRKQGRRAIGNLGAVVAQFYRTDMTTAADRAGQARATGALTDMDLDMTNKVATAEKAARGNYAALMLNVFGQKWLPQKRNNELRPLIGRFLNDDEQPPTMLEFSTFSDQLTQARGDLARDLENVQATADTKSPAKANPKVQAAVAEIEDAIRIKVGDERFEETMLAIDRDGAINDAFYKDLAERLVLAKQIKAEAVQADYRPQQAIPEVIIANRAEWNALLLRQFKGEKPPPEWVNDNYADLLGDDVSPGVARTLLIEPGETFEDLTERLPSLAAALSDAYETGRRQLLAESRQEAIDDIEQEMTRFVGKTYQQVMLEYNDTAMKLAGKYNQAKEKLETLEAKLAAIDPKIDKKGTAQEEALKAVNDQLDKWDLAIRNIRKHEELHGDLLEAQRRTIDMEEDVSSKPYDPRAITNEAEARQAELDRFSKILSEHSKTVKKQTGAQPKKATKEAADDTRKIQQKMDVESAKRTIKETIRDVTDGIIAGRGMQVPGKLQALSTSKHFKRRAINLAGIRHDPNVSKFFRKDAELTRELYTFSAGRQANLELQFGSYLDNAGREAATGEAHQNIPKLLRSVADDDFEADMAMIEGRIGKDGYTPEDAAKELAELSEDRKFWMTYLDDVMGEYTRSDFLGNAHPTIDRAVAIGQTVTTQAILGNVMLSFVSDLGMVALSGGKLGVGFKGFLGGKGINKAIKDIAGEDLQFEMVLLGPNADRAATGNNMYDLDSPTVKMGEQGTLASKFQAGAQTTAVAEGWANMMHPWNKWVRKVAGIGNAEHILKTALKGPLSPDDVVHFSKLGLDNDILGAMAILTRKFPVKSGSFELTDITKWADETVTYNGNKFSGNQLVKKFKNAITVASNQALLDPGLGDRPFMRSTASGRLFLTLSSFMYKAGQTYVSPLIQAGRINPRDGRVYVSAIASLLIPIIANEVRDLTSGKEGRLSKLDDPGVLAEVLKEGIMRSPFVTGVSGTFIDSSVSMLGDELNAVASAAFNTDREMLNTDFSRRNGNIGNLLGPVFGTASRVADMVANASTKSPEEAALGFLKVTPVFNTIFPMLALNKLLGDN
tara:strand:- start:13 stop:4407 length:4395 start_codon:yes stop_codon:yes gene_type:complete